MPDLSDEPVGSYTDSLVRAEGRFGREVPKGPPLQPPGGGGTFDGMLEARVAALDAHVEHIKKDVSDIKNDVRELRKSAATDFRITFGAIITVAIGLAGLMAKGFKWI